MKKSDIEKIMVGVVTALVVASVTCGVKIPFRLSQRVMATEITVAQQQKSIEKIEKNQEVMYGVVLKIYQEVKK